MTFRHEAFFYADTEEFLTEATSFIQDGLRRAEPVLVLVDTAKIALLRSALNGEADVGGVIFGDMTEVGHNPARIIPTWHDFVDDHAGRGVGLRGIGEPIGPHTAGPGLVECQQHEALLNVAFPDGIDLWLMCPYHAVLAAPILEAAGQSHPTLVQGGVRRSSPRYREVASSPHPLGDPLPESPGRAFEMKFDAGELTALRAVVAVLAHELAGFDDDRQADLVLSVNELATNSILYAGGSGTLRIWREESSLVCEVSDDGHITDPLVGRQAPGTAPESSRGLWVVNQLCDLVQVRSSRETGTIVRLHMDLDSRRPH